MEDGNKEWGIKNGIGNVVGGINRYCEVKTQVNRQRRISVDSGCR